MANIPITQLPNADPLTGTELVPIVQNGVTVRTTTQAISQSPSLNQTFLTVGLESTLPNSRYFSTDNSLTITDNGPQSFFRIGLTGAVADFNSIGNGFVVKTSPTSLLNRSIAVANAGLSITDGSGLSGNPTLSLSGLPLSLAQASGSGLLSLDSGSMLSPVAITGTAGQISVANGTGVGGNPTLSLDATGVVSGSYTLANITVDGYGRITSASNGTVVGTVSSVSVVNANGFSGNVADATGNASITIETTVTGILKGNGTAISAATSGVDYAPATSGTSILYGDGSGGFSNVTIGTGLTFSGGTLSATGGGGSVTSVTASAPLASSGGSTPNISITQAGSSTDGYLSSTDWNTFNNKGNGTVTSVGLTAGTGISVSGSPITGSGSITVTNTAPDQIVTLTAGSNVTITGTYPSFTIAATGGGGGSGTVTSVGLALPSEFTITNSPVTTSGTLTGAWASQTQNYVLASPNGSSGTPSFRALVSADIPALNYAPPTSGTDILYGNGTGGFSNATVGTGLSFTGGTLSNSAPDQVVTLTAGTGISVSGTYPSFTVTNSAPDQVVSLTAGANISITGTYPSFTIAATGLPTGDVVGPASATDNAIARFDGTTGKLIQNSAVTIADDGATVIDVNSTSDALRITQTGTGNAILVEDSANPDSTPFVVDQNGRVISGGLSPYSVGTVTPKFQSVTNSVFDGGFGGSSWSSDANGQITWFAKSKSGTIGTHSAVASGDVLMDIRNFGSDGTNFVNSSRISAQVDGTVATNSVPGRLTFSTTPEGGTSYIERMRITNAGLVGIGATPSAGQTLVVARNITGSTAGISILGAGTVQSDVTSRATYFNSFASTAATTFTVSQLIHFYANQGTFGAGSTVSSQYGFLAENSLVNATNNYGFFSNIASGTGDWNFYAAGTADNYFAGNTGVGRTPNAAVRLDVGGTYGSSGNESFGVYSRGTIPSTSTSAVYGFASQQSTQDAAFTLTGLNHFGAIQGTITGGSRTAPTNQIGFNATATLTGATNNFGFYGNIASGTGRWNFYANGTAANYFAGTTLIGNTTDRGGSLQLAGSTSAAATTQRITGFAFDSRLRLGRANAAETVVASGDSIGILAFDGYDGAAYLASAQISAVVDNTPGTNDMPGRLVFSTTADGASSPTERFRISSFGGWGLAGANYGTSGTQAIVSNGNAAAPTWQDVVTPTATQTLTNKTLNGAVLNDGYTEEVYAVVDAATPTPGVALSPTNGSIQTWTLGGNRTPTAGTWAAGQSITLMINDSASSFTVTWTSLPVTWVGGSAPSLAPASGFTIITLWKVGTTIYGALVGQVT